MPPKRIHRIISPPSSPPCPPNSQRESKRPRHDTPPPRNARLTSEIQSSPASASEGTDIFTRVMPADKDNLGLKPAGMKPSRKLTDLELDDEEMSHRHDKDMDLVKTGFSPGSSSPNGKSNVSASTSRAALQIVSPNIKRIVETYAKPGFGSDPTPKNANSILAAVAKMRDEDYVDVAGQRPLSKVTFSTAPAPTKPQHSPTTHTTSNCTSSRKMVLKNVQPNVSASVATTSKTVLKDVKPNIIASVASSSKMQLTQTEPDAQDLPTAHAKPDANTEPRIGEPPDPRKVKLAKIIVSSGIRRVLKRGSSLTEETGLTKFKIDEQLNESTVDATARNVRATLFMAAESV